jgi:hypothetical protein
VEVSFGALETAEAHERVVRGGLEGAVAGEAEVWGEGERRIGEAEVSVSAAAPRVRAAGGDASRRADSSAEVGLQGAQGEARRGRRGGR